MKENTQILLRMLTEFHRQVQDSLGERGKPALLLGNPVVRTFNAYLNQMREMFPDSFIAQLPNVESVPELGEIELVPEELEMMHLSKTHEVAMACSQIIEYLSGMLNGEAGFSKAILKLPEILAVLDTLRQEIQGLQLTDGEEGKRITEMLVGKYNDCLSVCHETVGEGDAILPRLFKLIEFAGDELSYAAKIQEVKISASGLYAYLEGVEQQEADLKKQQRASTMESRETARRWVKDSMKSQKESIRSELEYIRQQAEESKEQIFEKIDGRIENVEVQFEERVQQLEERLDEVNQKINELKDRCNETVDERVNELDERIENLEEKLNERIEEHEEKHDSELEHIQEELRGEIEGLEEKIGEFEERIGGLQEGLDEKIEQLSEEREESANGLEERIQELREEMEEKFEELREKIDE